MGMKRAHIVLAVGIWAIGCSSTPKQPSPPAQQAETLNDRFDKIKIGDTRDHVERQLGHPFSFQRTEFDETAMYMAGMEDMMAKMREMQAPSTGGSVVTGLLRGAAGIVGLAAGPAGGLAVGIGSQVLSMGETVTGQTQMPDLSPGTVAMLTIRYRDGKVVSLEKQTPGQMGALPELPQMPPE